METNTIIILAGLSLLLFVPGLISAGNFIVYREIIPKSLRSFEFLRWFVFDIFSGIMGGLAIFSYFFFSKPISKSILTILFSIIGVILFTLGICLIWERIYKRTYFKRNLKKTQKITASRKRLDELANEYASKIPAPPPKAYEHKKKTPTSSEEGKIVYLNHKK